MIGKALGIFGWDIYMPPAKSVKQLVLDRGGDPTSYLENGWQNICVATELDQPDKMCSSTLKQALEKSQVSAKDLKIVICTSVSHDYPELSSSLEVMRDLDTSENCSGMDLFQGCLGTLSALEIVRGWLESRGGGYGAIVSAEKWADTIDKGNKGLESMWSYADGGTALVVGVDTGKTASLRYRGTSFHTRNEMSGQIRRVFGGARAPATPPGESPFKRVIRDLPPDVLQNHFSEGYRSVIERYQENHGAAEWMVCNQQSPGVVELLEYMTGIDPDSVGKTGDQFGHAACSDVVLGLANLKAREKLKGKGMVLACNVSCWGAACLEAD